MPTPGQQGHRFTRAGGGARITVFENVGAGTYSINSRGTVMDASGAVVTHSDIIILVGILKAEGETTLAAKVQTWWKTQ